MVIINRIEYLAYIIIFVICLSNNKAIAGYFMVICCNNYHCMINLYQENEFSEIELITQNNINILSKYDLLIQHNVGLRKLYLFMMLGLQNIRTKILSHLEKTKQPQVEDNFNIELFCIILAIRSNISSTKLTDKILDFLNYLLKQNNFNINSKNIYTINSLDFLVLSGVEAFYKTSLKKNNTDFINISILEQPSASYRVLTNRNTKKNMELVFTNNSSYNLYQRLGQECIALFEPNTNNSSKIALEFKNVINNSQLGVEFNSKTEQNLFDYLVEQPDEVKGLVIMEYFFYKQYQENNLKIKNIPLKCQDSTEIIEYIDLLQIIMCNKLSQCIEENIEIMFCGMKCTQMESYYIILGDFIINNFIRSMYYKGLINRDTNLPCDKVLILSPLQFYLGMAEASKEVVAGYNKQDNNFVIPEWNPIKFDVTQIAFLTRINQLFTEILDNIL